MNIEKEYNTSKTDKLGNIEKRFSKIQKFLIKIIIISVILYLFSSHFVVLLPDKSEILPELLIDPVQKETDHSIFDLEYRGKNYEIKPMFDYELYGLVVSVNDIKVWYNIYKNEDTVNFKDACVIWGSNLESNDFHEVEYWSGEYTCFSRYKLNLNFNHNKISNNHFITDDSKLQKLASKIRIGDQIHFQGFLIDYRDKNCRNERYCWSKTSISREDINESARGGGACEIVFLENFEILKRNNNFWNFLHIISFWAFVFSIIGIIINFVYKAQSEKKLLK